VLIVPAVFHRLVERGEDTQRLPRLIGLSMRPALMPFLIVMGLDVFMATRLIEGLGLASVLAVTLVVGTLSYLLRLERRGRLRGKRRHPRPMEDEPAPPTPIGSKIRHVLTETRVVLPGAQALLGFQFAILFTQEFERLPQSSQRAHLASLACIALTTMLLIAPAAAHRIVWEGEETIGFFRYATRMMLAALVPLGFGVVLDFYVVTRKVTGSLPIAVTSGALMLLVLFAMWFGLSLVLRWRHGAHGTAPR
jgi:hypothetical protein